jgi:hypothetical protein
MRPVRREVAGYVPAGVSENCAALWRDFFVVLSFSWCPDFCFWFAEETGGGRRTGPPVLLIYWREDIAPACRMRPLLCTVMPREELLSAGRDVTEQLRRDEEYASRCGWDFRVLGESEVRTTFLTNANSFHQFRDGDKIDEGHAEIIGRAMNGLRLCDVETLLVACSDDDSFRERLKTTVWSIILTGRFIQCDVTAPINLRTVLWDTHFHFPRMRFGRTVLDAMRVMPGNVAELNGEAFFITHLLDVGHALGRSLETGVVIKLRLCDLKVRLDAAAPTYFSELYPATDGDWMHAQRRLSIIAPFFNGRAANSASVRETANAEGVPSGDVHRWLKSYSGRGRLYQEAGHTLSLVPQGRYVRVHQAVRDAAGGVANSAYFAMPSRPLNAAVSEVMRRVANAGVDAPHPSAVRNAVADACEELVFLNRASGQPCSPEDGAGAVLPFVSR